MQHNGEQHGPGDGLQEHSTALGPLISSRASSVKTTDANPRGPNQPMNVTVTSRSRVPITASATGTILTTVRLSSA